LDAVVKQQFTEENQEEKLREFYREFNNKITNDEFQIEINTIHHQSFQSIDYNEYMLNLDDAVFEKSLKLSDLFKKVFFSHNPFPDTTNDPVYDVSTENQHSLLDAFLSNKLNGQAIQQVWIDKINDLKENANNFLENCLEDITIDIDISDDYSIKLIDVSRNLSTKEIKKYFNEAKLNLVIFALLFSVIKISKDVTKKNILILDDFITSLDMANRTFVMKYILEEFKDFQILLFTHNVYFYNLIMYLINDKICITDKEWQFGNLYEVGIEHKIYIKDNKDTVDKLEDEYRLKGENFNIAEYGNQLRHKFERLLYEFSKILMVGGVEESNKILEGIANQRIYFNYSDQKDSSDLIQGIEAIIQRDETKEAIVGQINSQINRYKIIILDDIRQTLNTLKLYRKVTMHSLSHGQTGQHNWGDKEIKQTLFLLKKLETNIKDLTNQTAN
jgi:hypothetical protein